MNNLTSVLVTLSLSSFLVACQQDADTPQTEPETKSFSQASLLAQSPGDFSSSTVEAPELPPINNNKESLSYISTPPQMEMISAPKNQHTSISDEYWTTVSGAELNKGVNLAISQPSSVIRISPRADTSTGTLTHSKAITPDKIQLFRVDKGAVINRSSSYIHTMVDADALATAGLTDDSSALTMSASAKPGQYQLKVNQALSANSSYLINVKEKNSPYQLTLSNQTRLSNQFKAIDFELQLSGSDTNFTPQASLKHSDGRYQPLEVQALNGQWQAQIPDNTAMPSSNSGLTEMQINIHTQINGVDVIRTVKSAFKQYTPSARLQPQANTQWNNAIPERITFNLEIGKAGRFALSAYLTGTDSAGQDQVILKTESANWLTEDNASLNLALDPKLILASGLKPPFKLKGLELKDQGQMARLSYQQEALILDK